MIKGGPKIINDGLVLCLDAHDAKSYAGEPTTNLLGSNDNPLNGMSNITLTKIETQADGWIKYSMSGTFTGGTYPYMSYIDTVSFTGGTAYTSRAMIKTNVESKFNYFGTTGINYVNQPKDAEGTARSVVTEENGFNVYTVSREGFIYTSTTSQRGYLFTNPINNTTFNSSTDFMWIKNVQVEQKTYPTPWTYTSRSATNGWVDRSGNSNSGTLTNMIGTEASHYRDGQVIMPVANSYLDFDGSDDYININHNSVFDTNIFTIEIWFKSTTDDNTHDSLITRNADVYSSTNGWSLGKLRNGLGGTTNALRWLVWGTSTYTDLSGDSTASGNWTQAVGVSDGTNLYLYQNAVQKASGSKPAGNIYPSSYGFKIGANKSSSDIWNGQIAKINFYNKALTVAQILSNYNTTKNRFS